jgi:hypothetical protein
MIPATTANEANFLGIIFLMEHIFTQATTVLRVHLAGLNRLLARVGYCMKLVERSVKRRAVTGTPVNEVHGRSALAVMTARCPMAAHALPVRLVNSLLRQAARESVRLA